MDGFFLIRETDHGLTDHGLYYLHFIVAFFQNVCLKSNATPGWLNH